jgi:hypothetical protein
MGQPHRDGKGHGEPVHLGFSVLLRLHRQIVLDFELAANVH